MSNPESQPAELNEIQQLEQQGFILHCVRCNYVLRGLDPANACPECGLAIKHSLRSTRLIDVDPLFVNRLSIGMGILALAQVAMVLGNMPVWRLSSDYVPTRQWLFRLVQLGYYGLPFTALAAWLITGRDVAAAIGGRIPRRDIALRWVATLRLFLPFVIEMFAIFMESLAMAWLEAGVAIACYVLLLLRVREIARRLENDNLQWHATLSFTALAAGATVSNLSTLSFAMTRVNDSFTVVLAFGMMAASAYSAWVAFMMARALALTARTCRDNWPVVADANVEIAEKSPPNTR